MTPNYDKALDSLFRPENRETLNNYRFSELSEEDRFTQKVLQSNLDPSTKEALIVDFQSKRGK